MKYPKDRDSDFQVGEVKEGKVIDYDISPRGRKIFVIVQFSDGWVTKIHRHSFDYSGSCADFYYPGDPITVKKKGFNKTQKFAIWKILNPQRYDPRESEYDWVFKRRRWHRTKQPSPSILSPIRWVKKLFDRVGSRGA